MLASGKYLFRARDGEPKWLAIDMFLCGLLEVLVLDIPKGTVQADALEAVVQPYGPLLFARPSWKKHLGEQLETFDERVTH